MTVMPFVLIVQLVLSGVLFTLESGMEQVAKFTISKWGMEALGAASDVDGLPYNELGWNILPRDAYAFETDHVVESLGIIIAFAALYILISIISLKFVDKDKR